MKKISFAIAVLAFIYSCKHLPEVPPSNNTGGTNNPPVNPVNNCNPDSVYFENDILPLLRSNCGMPGCHDAVTKSDGIDITSYTSLVNSGAVKPGNVNGSDLIEAVNETDPGKIMPRPPRSPLTQEQINMLTKWIQQGAKNNKCNSGCDTTKFAFAANVQLIIDAKCKGCHNNTAPSGNVSLTNYGEVKAQADNGKLLGTIKHDPGFKTMPLGAKLPDCEIAIISKWVQAGAPNN